MESLVLSLDSGCSGFFVVTGDWSSTSAELWLSLQCCFDFGAFYH